MNTPDARHQRKLRQLAKEYEKRGYRVQMQVKGWSLPPFLSGFQPDMVAFSQEDNVVVEIKTQDQLRESPRLGELATIIQRQKGWRFELVVLNPPRRLVDSEAIPLTRSDAEARLDSSKRLLSSGDSEAAFLLAWTTIEAQLRVLTTSSQLNVSSTSSTGQLIKKLFTLGVFSREDYDSLMEALDQRNTVVHGFRSGQVHAWAQRTIRLSEKIMSWKSLTEQSPPPYSSPAAGSESGEA